MWKIVPQGNSTYKIKVIDEDKLYGVEANSALYANSYIAVSEGKTTVDPLVDKSTAGYENAGDEWKFVTPAVYEAFHAKKQLQEQLMEIPCQSRPHQRLVNTMARIDATGIA